MKSLQRETLTEKIPLWEHQKECIDRAKNLNAFGLFFEMGCGKTAAAINILRHKYSEAGRVMRTLVICPPIVIKNWRREFAAHSQIRGNDIQLLLGSGKARGKVFEARRRDTGIFILNYESLLMRVLFEAFLKWKPEIIVFDESQKLKDPKAKRSKLAELLSNPRQVDNRCVPIKLLLSGSPILNTPLDIFHQYKVMDGGATFGKSFFKFRAMYFADRNAWMVHAGRPHFPKWDYKTLDHDGFDALKAINELMAPNSMRVKKEDCLDLPPLVRETRFVSMSTDQARLYKEMKRDFITFMGSHACTATLAITKALRLMQIASGYVKTEDGMELSLGVTPKQAALKELLEQLTPDHKVIVWAVWKENYGQIRKVCEDLKISYVEITGEISSKGKDEAVERFNTERDVRVLIGNPGAGGLGINLVSASYSCFYSRNFSLENSIQAEARNHRGGSEIHKKITRIDLITEGTIDELVTERLLSKKKISEKVLQNLKEEI